MDHGGVVDGYGRIKHDHAWSLGGIPYWKDLDVHRFGSCDRIARVLYPTNTCAW